jgi:DNA-binding NarL/FixJ family response regulator
MNMMIQLLALGGGFVLVLVALAWCQARQQAALERVDDRVAHLLAAISLLTDTMEGGLRDVGMEIGRLAGAQAAGRPTTRSATQRRVRSAARRGRSVQDIAAAEQLSEGEVRLHLNLDRSPKERSHHASMR